MVQDAAAFPTFSTRVQQLLDGFSLESFNAPDEVRRYSEAFDIEAICRQLVPEGVIAAIAGRALYEGKLDLKTAQAAADKALGKS